MSAKMLNMSQQRQSNIAVVRLTKHGKKLEVACYKNKAVAYRAGIEKRIDEVIQIDRVFTNVSAGDYASLEDIQLITGEKMSEKEAVRYVLDKGELQVAQSERKMELENVTKKIAAIISQKCVNTTNNRPFPPSMIEQALKKLGATIHLEYPPKKQALGFIKLLEESQILPIQRALMKVRCDGIYTQIVENAQKLCKAHPRCRILENSEMSTESTQGYVVMHIESHLFKEVEKMSCSVQVIEVAVMDLSETFVQTLDTDSIETSNTISAMNTSIPRQSSASPSLQTGDGAKMISDAEHKSDSDEQVPEIKSNRAKLQDKRKRRAEKQALALEAVMLQDSDSESDKGRKQRKRGVKGKNEKTCVSADITEYNDCVSIQENNKKRKNRK
eukprot:Tbor_TRINITY_DN4810_c0_g1::TRINITY_DN4810_c0_g1_i1::g.1510::m.1510/K14574/SDO1, SBDS; ribosome maturation protein SDO1